MQRKLRADWDLLEHNFYRVVSDYRTDAKSWAEQAEAKGITLNRFIAARLTHSAITTFDFAFETNVDWKDVCNAMSSVLDDENHDTWRILAKRRRQTITRTMACVVFMHAVEVIDSAMDSDSKSP